MVSADTVIVSGEPMVYPSSEGGRRSSCGDRKTGLFLTNAILAGMGMMQVRSAALEEHDAVEPRSQM